MDFNLSQDQQFFRETIRSFVDKEIRPVASELEKSGTDPDEIVKKMKWKEQRGFRCLLNLKQNLSNSKYLV